MQRKYSIEQEDVQDGRWHVEDEDRHLCDDGKWTADNCVGYETAAQATAQLLDVIDNDAERAFQNAQEARAL